jgi:hypothetical protein
MTRLRKYSLFLNAILIILYCARSPENKDWENAKSEDTIQAYSTYLRQYGEGEYAYSARIRIEQLEYHHAQLGNTIQSYNDFIRRHPQSSRSDSAKHQIEKMLNERHPAFRDIRSIKIIYNEPDQSSTGIQRAARQILREAGVDANPFEEAETDALLKINIEWTPLSGMYTDGSIRSSGASVKGTFSFEIPGTFSLEKSFRGKREPLEFVQGKHRNYTYTALGIALRKSKYYPLFLEVTRDLFGPACIRNTMFKGYDSHIRSSARQVLGLSDDEAAGLAIAQLKNPDSIVRQNACELLGTLNNPRAADPLIKAYYKEPDKIVRREAIQALYFIVDSSHVDVFISALEDEHSEVREWAAISLKKLKHPASISPLIAALNTKNNRIKKQIKDALAGFGGLSVEPLIQALKEDDNYYKNDVRDALSRITNQDLGTSYYRWIVWWRKNRSKFAND